MNYYRRYIGDYLRDTARLSVLEHGAYSLMLDYYYADEKPLPLDRMELYTMVRAMRPEDQTAVDKILSLYFMRRKDGFHNGRADEEIAVSQTARENGKHGGRPRTEQPTGAGTGGETGLVTEPETGSETGTDTESLSEQGGGSGHPPTSNLQPPSASLQPPGANQGKAAPKTRRSARKPTFPMPEDFAISERVRKWAQGKGFDMLDEHLESFKCKAVKKGYAYTLPDGWDLAFMDAIREDWAGLRSGRQSRQSSLEAKNRAAAANFVPPEDAVTP